MSAAGYRKPDGRGGRRPGAGRKPGSRQPVSVRHVQELRKAAKARAKLTGKSLADIVLDIAYDESETVRNRLAATKLYWDKMMVRIVEDVQSGQYSGPAIFLPEHRDRIVEMVKKSER